MSTDCGVLIGQDNGPSDELEAKADELEAKALVAFEKFKEQIDLRDLLSQQDESLFIAGYVKGCVDGMQQAIDKITSFRGER